LKAEEENAPGEYIPGKYTPYYSLMEADSGGGTGLKDEYLRILEAGPPKPTPAPAPAPAPAPVAISTVEVLQQHQHLLP
jgi:hypothetical protein